MSKVLFATIMGGFEHATKLEQKLARKLLRDGHDVEFLLCDSLLPACQMLKFNRNPVEKFDFNSNSFSYCKTCVTRGLEDLGEFSDKLINFSEHLNSNDKELAKDIAQSLKPEEVANYTFRNIRVGMHTLAGTIRYFAKKNIWNEPKVEKIISRYLEASILAVLGIENLQNLKKYDAIVINHGIYVPQGPIAEFARLNSRVVTWNPSYRNSTYIFSHNESYHFSMATEKNELWNKLILNDEQKIRLKNYLKDRELGLKDWIKFSDSHLGINTDKKFSPPEGYSKIFVALTSVVWDAELHYSSRAFPSMFEWLAATIEYFVSRPDLALIIRVHPAEILAPTKSREKVSEFIDSKFNKLPKNIFIIDSDNSTNTHAIIDKSDYVLIYNTKTGIEAASKGKVVVVAGEAWVKGKGFTVDVFSSEEYHEKLDYLSKNIVEMDVELANKYAYHFFFRRMIEIDISQDTLLMTKRVEYDHNLEIVTKAILDGTSNFYV